MSSGFSGAGFQTAFGSLASDATIKDGNTATGPDTTGAVDQSLTGVLDFGAIVSFTDPTFIIGYSNTPTAVFDYSDDHSSWTTLTFSSLPSFTGVFTSETRTVTGTFSGRYLRISATDHSEDYTENNARVTIREVSATLASSANWSGEADGTSGGSAGFTGIGHWSGESDGVATGSYGGLSGGLWSGRAAGTSDGSAVLGGIGYWSGQADGQSGPSIIASDGGLRQGCGGCAFEVTAPCVLPNSNIDQTLTWRTPAPIYTRDIFGNATGILAGGFDLTACSVDPTPYFNNDSLNTCYRTQIGTAYRYNFDNAVLSCADNLSFSPPQYAGASVTKVYYYYTITRTTTTYHLDVTTGAWVVDSGQPTVVTSHITGEFDSHDVFPGYTFLDFYTGKRTCRGLKFINLTISEDNYDCNNWLDHSTRPPGRTRTVVSTTHTVPVFRADVKIVYYHCPVTTPVGLCPGVHGWGLSGIYHRKKYDLTHFGSPYKQAPLSIFYKNCRTPHLKTSCLNKTAFAGNELGDYCYCSNGDLAVDVVLTDCSGNYTWSRSGDISAIGVGVGVWTQNPHFNALDCSGVDAQGNPNNQYFIRDPSVPEWLCAPNTGIDMLFASTPAANPVAFNDLTILEYADGTGNSGCAPNTNSPSSHPDHVPGETAPTLWDDGYDSTHTTTVFTLDIADGSPGVPVRCVASLNGVWHDVSALYNAQGAHGTLTIGDSCTIGGSTTTASGVCAYLAPAQPSDPQLFVPYNVDWFRINSVIPAGHTLTSAEVLAAPIFNPYGPGLSCGRNSGIEIYPDNFISAGNALATARDGAPTLFVYLGDFSGPQGLIHAAASYRSTVTLAWVSLTGAVKVATHRGMQADIGMNAGWEPTITLLSSGGRGVGVTYTQAGWLYITSGASGQWISKDQGKTFTSLAGSGPPSDCGPSAQGAGETWTSFIFGDRGAFNPCLARCRDNRGTSWDLSTVGGGVYSDLPLYTAVVFLESLWAFMYNNPGGTATLARTLKWTQPHLTLLDNTTIPVHGTGAGMAAAQGGVLVLLLWDQFSHKCHAAWSGDRGRTWGEGADLPMIPALVNPPVLVSLEGGSVAAVWEQGDVPAFRMTFTGGRDWE